MKRLTLAALLVCLAAPVFAEGASCTASAAEKKLAGAAKKSFLDKCERDATARCEAAAAEKKLKGAAKTSYTGKCVKDAVGAP